MRSEDVTEMLLFCSPVFAFSCDGETEDVAPEVQARVRVGDHDCGVVDAEEKAAVFRMPPWVPLARRKLEDFQRVPVRVLEVKGANPASLRVPIGKALRRTRCTLDVVSAQQRVGAVHVA